MRRYLRLRSPGSTYFFTLALQDRRSRCLVDHVGVLRSAVARVRQSRPFTIDAMVVLPDHLHAIWTLPAGDSDYPMRWRLIKRDFTRSLREDGLLAAAAAARRGADERSVWQRRYWEHQIRDERDYARHVDYVHFNPVKHGYVLRAGDWPHSSFHRFVREGILPADWGIAAGVRVEGGYGEV